MRIRVRGDGSPPFYLLIHGTASSGRIWLKMLQSAEDGGGSQGQRQRLAQEDSILCGTFIMPDLPGMGESKPLPDPTFDGWVEYLGERLPLVIEQAGHRLSGPVHLVGHSLGAAVAMHLAPLEWVESVALVCPATAAFCRELRLAHGQGSRLGSIRLRRVQGSLAHDPLALTREDAAMLRDDYEKASELLESGLPWPDFDVDETRLLAGKRTLVVWGEKDRVVDPAYARALADILDAAGVHVERASIRDCGHLPMLEHPLELSRVLGHFWNQ
ncbi:MAG: alpha/beta fold hydrolase [Bacillota bacterium]